MKKKILLRCLAGAPIGLAVSTIVTIVISLIVNDGRYHAIVPELASDFGTEMNAVLIQAIFSMLYGAVFGGASAIWDTDWSILRMTVTHFIICSIATFPIAYLMRWMDHTAAGILLYFGIFVVIYVIIWCSQYTKMKQKVQAMNKKLSETK
ncbi:MAG: DUF3021 domain-containing protein [Thermocaproicibacter melissae]|jgi:hypothetical protein|uniref:DUF3021 domain-containing protein n=1 Tax=[Clostridium] cellulosi TaxID=29343 RepID=A0A078KJV9_9FIRM|nr:MAG: DUF3021 domain-containing protein [[Clostridium] cellulosi]CDZ23916.1 hypothetical protein CCDG5_0787 [[Clostridium] cellulosi]